MIYWNSRNPLVWLARDVARLASQIWRHELTSFAINWAVSLTAALILMLLIAGAISLLQSLWYRFII